jgi:hypothetical protein
MAMGAVEWIVQLYELIVASTISNYTEINILVKLNRQVKKFEIRGNFHNKS